MVLRVFLLFFLFQSASLKLENWELTAKNSKEISVPSYKTSKIVQNGKTYETVYYTDTKTAELIIGGGTPISVNFYSLDSVLETEIYGNKYTYICPKKPIPFEKSNQETNLKHALYLYFLKGNQLEKIEFSQGLNSKLIDEMKKGTYIEFHCVVRGKYIYIATEYFSALLSIKIGATEFCSMDNLFNKYGNPILSSSFSDVFTNTNCDNKEMFAMLFIYTEQGNLKLGTVLLEKDKDDCHMSSSVGYTIEERATFSNCRNFVVTYSTEQKDGKDVPMATIKGFYDNAQRDFYFYETKYQLKFDCSLQVDQNIQKRPLYKTLTTAIEGKDFISGDCKVFNCYDGDLCYFWKNNGNENQWGVIDKGEKVILFNRDDAIDTIQKDSESQSNIFVVEKVTTGHKICPYESQDKCKKCSGKMMIDSTKGNKCIDTCPAENILDFNKYCKCQKGSYDDSSKKCEVCPGDQFNVLLEEGKEECRDKDTCTSSYAIDETEKTCKFCKGFSQYKYDKTSPLYDDTKDKDCVDSPFENEPYYYVKEDENLLARCREGCSACSSYDECTSCTNPKFGLSTTSTPGGKVVECKKCPETDNKYLYEGKCITPNFNFKVTDEEYGVIEKCHDNCKTCSGKSDDDTNQKCLTCVANRYLQPDKSNCELTCPEEYGKDTDTTTNTGVCLRCYPNKYKYKTGEVCLDTKPSGTFIVDPTANNNIIDNCFQNCEECTSKGDADDNKCTKCIENYFMKYDETAKKLSSNCDTSCNNQNVVEDSDKRECVNCALTQKFNYNGQCIEEQKEGTYISVPDYNVLSDCYETCKTCSTKGDQTNNKCYSCKATFNSKELYSILMEDNQEGVKNCDVEEKCTSAYSIDEGTKTCKYCKGFGLYKFDKNEPYYNAATDKDCVTLPDSFYYVSEQEHTIGHCKDGCSKCDSASKCTSCTDPNHGLYTDSQGVTSCINCKTQSLFRYKTGVDGAGNADITCKSKPVGYFVDSQQSTDNTYNLVQPCNSNCQDCETSKDVCTKCPLDKVLGYITKTCEDSCLPDGYFVEETDSTDNTRVCASCKDKNGAFKFIDKSQCTDSTSGKYFYEIETSYNVIGECAEGCVQCEKLDGSTSSKCTKCANDKFMRYNSDACDTKCENDYGYIEGDNVCLKCPDNQSDKKYLYEGKCISAPSDKFEVVDKTFGKIEKCHGNCEECYGKEETDNQNCRKCKDGLFLQPNSKNCEASCPGLYVKETTSNKCVLCDEYTKLLSDTDRVCVSESQCTLGDEVDASARTCKYCKGFGLYKYDKTDPYYNEANDKACVQLPGADEPFYVKESDQNILGHCPDPCSKCESSTKCTKCKNANHGLFTNDQGGIECTNCKDKKGGLYRYKTGDDISCQERPKMFFVDKNSDTDKEYNLVQRCDNSCEDCEDSSTYCTACGGGQVVSTTHTCVQGCLDEKEGISNGACINCKNENKYKIIGTLECLTDIKPGYYLPTSPAPTYNILEKCGQGCKECDEGPNDAGNNCKSCNGNQVVDYLTKNCEDECKPTGYFPVEEINSVKTCVNCKDKGENFFKFINDDKCVNDISNKNKYDIEPKYNVIGECSSGCVQCSKVTDPAESTDSVCSKCDTSKFLDYETKKCEDSCGENYGYIEGTNECKKCPETNNAYLYEGKCITEPQFVYVVVSQEFGKIEKCHDNCEKCYGKGDDSNNNCEKCKADYFLQQDQKNCKQTCPDLEVKDISERKCIICQEYTMLLNSNDRKCVQENECTAAYEKDSTLKTCKYCAGFGEYKFDDTLPNTQTGDDKCVTNPTKYYEISTADKLIGHCKDGCETCDSGTKCTSCTDQYFGLYKKSETEIECANCKTVGGGLFRFKEGQDKTCQSKPKGYFVDKTNQIENDYNLVTECGNDNHCSDCVDSKDHCTACENGYVLTTSNTCVPGCEDPEKGKFNGNCIYCDEQSYYKIIGELECIQNVKPGYYIPEDIVHGILKECNSNCKECNGAPNSKGNNCKNCNSGKVLDYITKSCLDSCQPEGYFVVKTDPNDNTDKCTSCKDTNEYKFIKENTCTSQTDANFQNRKKYDIDTSYNVIGECKEFCETCSKKADSTDSLCTKCIGGKYKEFNGDSCSDSCGNDYGYIEGDNDCLKCPSTQSNKYLYNGKCITKPSEPFAPVVGQEEFGKIEMCHSNCEECYGKEDAANNNQNCKKCKVNLFLQPNSKNCESSCSSDFAEDSATRECLSCYPDKYKYASDKTCRGSLPIPKGTYIVDESAHNNVIDDCHQNCETCTAKGSDINNLCTFCIQSLFMQYDTTSKSLTQNCGPTCDNTILVSDSAKRECVNCKSLNQYKYKAQCVENIQKGTFVSNQDYNVLTDCYSTCDTCSGAGSEDNHQCTTCINGYEKDTTPGKQNNCIKKCDTTQHKFYTDKSGVFHCTVDNNCPNDMYLIDGGSECLYSCKDRNLYLYNGKCLSACPSGLKFDTNNKCYQDEIKEEEGDCVLLSKKIDDKGDKTKSILLNQVEMYANSPSKSSSRSIASSQVGIISNNEEIYTIYDDVECGYKASVKHNISFVNLTTCINKIKKATGKDNLIVAQSEVKRDLSSTNSVTGYVITDSAGNEQDLSLCEEDKYVTTSPVKVETINDFVKARTLSMTKGIDITNPESPFYNDFCFPFYDENGDVILKDRRQEYFRNNSFCEDGCDYFGIDFSTARVECKCSLKKDKFESLEDNFPLNDYPSKISKSNLIVVRCYNLVFNWKYMKVNIGSWIIICLILCVFITLFNFFYVRFKPIYAYLNQFSQKKIEEEMYENVDIESDNKGFPKDIKNLKRKTSLSSNPPKKQSKDTKKNQNYTDSSPNVPIVSHRSVKFPPTQMKLKSAEVFESITSNENIAYTYGEGSKKGLQEKESKANESFESEELNKMAYEDAKEYDHRSPFNFLCHCVKSNISFVSTFSNITPLDVVQARIIGFFLLLSSFLVLNAMLFDDSAISKKYHYNSKNDFVFIIKNELPKCVYVSLITTLVGFLIDYVTSSKKRFETLLKENKDHKEYLIQVRKIVKGLKIKMAWFFTIQFILFLGFWYYVSAFCAVYQKTQVSLIESVFISIVFCCAIQFVLCLFVVLFRYLGLKCGLRCFYTLSTYFV